MQCMCWVMDVAMFLVSTSLCIGTCQTSESYLHVKSLETVLLVDSPHNIRKPRKTECYTLLNITSVGTLCKLCQSSEGNYSVLQQEKMLSLV